MMTEPDEAARLEHGPKLDLATPDAARPARKRKIAALPDPPPQLRESQASLLRRALTRPIHPAIHLTPASPTDVTDQHWTSPHADYDLWLLQLADAFGTRSTSVTKTIIAQLQRLTADMWTDDEGWHLDENELTTMIAIINASKPRNELEAVQCVQMVANHFIQMRVADHVRKYPGDTKSLTALAKLQNAFSGQIEAMQKLKGKRRTARQSIKVTKETHYHVHQHPTPKGGKASPSQSHDIDGNSVVRREDEARNIVSLPTKQGQEALPPPRRACGGAER